VNSFDFGRSLRRGSQFAPRLALRVSNRLGFRLGLRITDRLGRILTERGIIPKDLNTELVGFLHNCSSPSALMATAAVAL